MSAEDMSVARNEEQDDQVETEEERFLSAQASVENNSDDEGAGEDEDEPEDFDE